MSQNDLVGRRVVLSDQGDGWFSGIPAAVIGRDDEVSRSVRHGRSDNWTLSLSLLARDGEPAPRWHGAQVTLTVDPERLGVVDGQLSFAPSVPAYLESPAQPGSASTGGVVHGGKVTVFPAAHFGHLIEFVGRADAIPAQVDDLVDRFEFEVPGDGAWVAADRQRVIRATREDRAPMLISGLGVAFALCRLDAEVAWELKGMPSRTGAPVVWRTDTALVAPETSVERPSSMRDSLAAVTIVPAVRLRDLGRLDVGSMFPVARMRLTAA